MSRTVDPQRLSTSIQMLREYMDDAAVEPLVAALEALAASPRDEALMDRLRQTFDELEVLQGAVLTYAPYVSFLLSDVPFGESGES